MLQEDKNEVERNQGNYKIKQNFIASGYKN